MGFVTTPDAGTGTVTEVAVGGYSPAEGGRGGLALDPAGSVWFGMFPATTVGRISAAGVLTTHDVGSVARSPLVAPDGMVWFGGNGQVGRIDPDTGDVRTWPVDGNADFLTLGADGAVWFGTTAGRIGRVDERRGVAQFDLTGAPWFLVAGADGNIWAGSEGQRFIARITPDGSVTRFTTSDIVNYLVADPRGLMWFAGLGTQTSGTVGSVVTGIAPPPSPLEPIGPLTPAVPLTPPRFTG